MKNLLTTLNRNKICLPICPNRPEAINQHYGNRCLRQKRDIVWLSKISLRRSISLPDNYLTLSVHWQIQILTHFQLQMLPCASKIFSSHLFWMLLGLYVDVIYHQLFIYSKRRFCRSAQKKNWQQGLCKGVCAYIRTVFYYELFIAKFLIMLYAVT